MKFNRKQIFSIRKTLLGVGSVLIALSFLGQSVSADEVLEPVNNSTELVATSQQNSQIPEPKVETAVIPATTEYVADETLEVGQSQVQTPAVDGKIEQITSYKQQETVVDPVDQSAKDAMAATDYKYGPSDFYHLDTTQEKPSDQVVIDKLFSDVQPMTLEEVKNNSSIRDMVTGGEYTIDERTRDNVTDRHALLKLTSLESSEKYIYLPTESIDPQNPAFQALLKNYSFIGTSSRNYSSTPWTGDLQGEGSEALRKAIYEELAKKAAENLANLAGFRYINDLVDAGSDEATALKGYFTSQLPITEKLYADAKADYERFLLGAKEAEMQERVSIGVGYDPKTQSSKEFYILNPVIRVGRDAFETITQRYNASKGYTQLPISFEDTFLSVEQQKALEKKIADIPEAVKSHILKLVVTGSELEPGDWARGVTYKASNDIWIRNFVEREFTVPTDQGEKIISLSVPQPFDLFDNFLHELGHAIDIMSGTRVYDYLAYQPDNGKIKQDLKNHVQPTVQIRSMMRLSYSDEFLKVFEEYFLNKEDVWDYIRWTPSEAWADSLGEYINKKLNGVAYTRYKKIGDTVYSYNPAYAGLNPEYDAMKETVYDVGYSPVEASEWYWESMYQKLFVPQILKEIVVDKVETKTTPAQNGKVLVGTKPKVQVEVLSYQTHYVADDTKDYGYRIEVGGVDGQKITTTTYVLVGQEAQANDPSIRQEAAIDKVVTLGTRAKQAQVNLVEIRTVYLDDQSLEVGTELEKQVGSQGYTMRTVTYRLNPETGEITETVTDVVTPMVERIVLRGSKSVLVVETEVLPTVKDNSNPLPKAEVVQTLQKDPVTTAEKPILTATVSKFDQGTAPSSSKETVLPKTGSTSGLALSLLGTVLFALGLAGKKEVE